MVNNKKDLRIECLNRYGTMTNGLEDILEFLLSERLISEMDIKGVKQSSSVAKELEIKLNELKHKSKLQLLEYEWNLLPVERIKIYIVTDRSSKEFTYNY